MYMDWEAGTWVPLPEEWARMLDATEDIIPDVQNAVVSFYIISYTVREMCGLFFLHLAINHFERSCNGIALQCCQTWSTLNASFHSVVVRLVHLILPR